MNHTSKYLCLYVALYHMVSELGHLTTFVQWDVRKHDTSGGLVSACTSRLGTLPRTQLHAVKKPKQPCGKAHMEKDKGPQPTTPTSLQSADSTN